VYLLARMRVPALVTLLALAAAPAASAAGWEEPATIPGSSGSSASSTTGVGLADDGAAAVAWIEGGLQDLHVATRDSAGGAWTIHDLDDGVEPGVPALAMNAAGDLVIAWVPNDGFIHAAYKPAGGPMEATAELDDDTLSGSPPGVSINSHGDAVVGWGAGVTTPAPTDQIRAVVRTKTGPWPATNDYEIAASQPAEGGEQNAISCGGPAAAIDDQGRALLTWSSDYGSFDRVTNNTVHTELYVCGVRAALWSGNTWGAPIDVTFRPDIGYNRTSGGTPAPDAGVPSADADPVTGKLLIAFRANDDAIVENPQTETGGSYDFEYEEGWETKVASGSVAAGPATPQSIGALGWYGQPQAGAGFGYGAVASPESDQDFFTPIHSLRAGGALLGSAPGFSPLSSDLARDGDVDVGGDGRVFAVFEMAVNNSREVRAWSGPAGQAPVGPVVVLSPSSSAPGVAANCHGDAIAAAASGSSVTYAEYLSGAGGACGSSPPPDGPGNPGGGGNDAPPSNVVTIARKPSAAGNGTVTLRLDLPGAGELDILGRASVATARRKKIVVTRKSLSVKAAGTVTVKLKATKAAKKKLKKKRRLKTSLAITFSPTGGTPATIKRSVTFKLKRPKKR
jgi:hypothetical protein